MRGLSRAGLIAAASLLLLAGCGAGGDRAETTLPLRSATAGSVTMTAKPVRVDAGSAEFAIELDTHSGDLNLDLGKATVLTVDGQAWPPATWDGDRAGGHHREGTLRFAAPAGTTARNRAELRVTGLESPVTFSWSLPARG